VGNQVLRLILFRLPKPTHVGDKLHFRLLLEHFSFQFFVVLLLKLYLSGCLLDAAITQLPDLVFKSITLVDDCPISLNALESCHHLGLVKLSLGNQESELTCRLPGAHISEVRARVHDYIKYA
jgi:hypothetical protein